MYDNILISEQENNPIARFGGRGTQIQIDESVFRKRKVRDHSFIPRFLHVVPYEYPQEANNV